MEYALLDFDFKIHIAVTLPAAVANSYAATLDFLRNKKVLITMARLGVPEGWLPMLGIHAMLVYRAKEHFDSATDTAAGKAYSEALQAAGVFVASAGLEPHLTRRRRLQTRWKAKGPRRPLCRDERVSRWTRDH